MKKIVSVGEKKVYMYLSKLGSVDARRTPIMDDGVVYPAYVVSINGSEDQFLFNGEKLYLERINGELQKKQIEEHTALAKQMETEGKTTEEITEYLRGLKDDFVDRVEYIIDCEGLTERLQVAIQNI